MMAFTALRSGMVWSWGDSRVGYQPSWSRIPVWSQCHTGGKWTTCRPVEIVDYFYLCSHLITLTESACPLLINQPITDFFLNSEKDRFLCPGRNSWPMMCQGLIFYSQATCCIVVLHNGSLPLFIGMHQPNTFLKVSLLYPKMQNIGVTYIHVIIGTSLSEPPLVWLHCAHACVCLLVCLLAWTDHSP